MMSKRYARNINRRVRSYRKTARLTFAKDSFTAEVQICISNPIRYSENIFVWFTELIVTLESMYLGKDDWMQSFS
jgi:hypothetical protein